MKLYKSVNGYLRFIRKLAKSQEVANLKGFDKLPPKAQRMLYELLGGIQNDIADIDRILNDPDYEI